MFQILFLCPRFSKKVLCKFIGLGVSKWALKNPKPNSDVTVLKPHLIPHPWRKRTVPGTVCSRGTEIRTPSPNKQLLNIYYPFFYILVYFTLCLDSISLQLNSYSSDSRSSADHLNRPRSKQSECWIDPEDKFKVLKSKHLRISLCFSSRSCSLTNCKDPPPLTVPSVWLPR